MALISPTVHTAGVSALELALNRALELDPAASRKLDTLQGQIFLLRCTSPELDFYLQPESGRISLMGYWDGEITTAITGQASDFAELAGAVDPTAALINGNLALEGDSASLIEFQKILSSLDMDWEAPLVRTFGDVAGHQLAQGLRGLFSWGRQASSGFSRQLEEFIVEEARLTPSRQEVEDFYQDLEDLKLRVDRMTAKLKKLSQLQHPQEQD
jgi:ubiquinone biosynthesis protein UbiJ